MSQSTVRGGENDDAGSVCGSPAQRLGRRSLLVGAGLALLPACWRGVFPVPWPQEDYAARGWSELGRALAWDRAAVAARAGVKDPMFVEPCPCPLSIPLAAKVSDPRQLLLQIAWTELNISPRTLSLEGLKLSTEAGAAVALPDSLAYSSQSPARVVVVPPEASRVRGVELEVRLPGKLPPAAETPTLIVWGQ